MKGEAWAALKNYKKGSKEIVELAGEVDKLARRLHPHDEEAAERQAMDTFLSVLERPLAAEVRKLGYHTMESVVTAARRIERILAEPADPEKELQIQEQIRLLQEGLEDVRRQIAQPPATTTASSAAQPPLPSLTPPPPPAHHAYQDSTEENPHFSALCRPQGQPYPPCFLCGEEGHLATKCSALQHLLRQPTPARLLEGPSETCLGFDVWRRYRAQWRPLRDSLRGQCTAHTANHSRFLERPSIWTFNGARLADGPALL